MRCGKADSPNVESALLNVPDMERGERRAGKLSDWRRGRLALLPHVYPGSHPRNRWVSLLPSHPHSISGPPVNDSSLCRETAAVNNKRRERRKECGVCATLLNDLLIMSQERARK